MKYDYFVTGRWRNRDSVEEVMAKLRAAGHSVYCFIENAYEGDGIKYDISPGADIEKMMNATENLKDWQTNPTFKKIYETDMNALKQSKAAVVVFPIGFSAHMELGAAYGLGKKCYGIGLPEKAETLYLMFDAIYPHVEKFLEAQAGVPA